MAPLTQFLIFGTIGFVNAILNVVIWKGLVAIITQNTHHKIHKTDKISAHPNFFYKYRYTLSHTISFFITVVTSYIPNKLYAFDASNSQDDLQLLKFMCVAVFSWVVTTIFIAFFTQNYHLERFTPIWKKYYLPSYPVSIKILSIAISMVTNFLGYKFLVF